MPIDPDFQKKERRETGRHNYLGPLGIETLWYVGWVIGAIGLPFFFSPSIYFRKEGKPGEGKSLMETTVIVDKGTYSIVRHPQILDSILLMSASILVSQHWLTAVISIPIMAWSYMEAAKAEEGLTIKFGNDYKRYMQKVPRMNILLGIIQFLQRRKRK